MLHLRSPNAPKEQNENLQEWSHGEMWLHTEVKGEVYESMQRKCRCRTLNIQSSTFFAGKNVQSEFSSTPIISITAVQTPFCGNTLLPDNADELGIARKTPSALCQG